MNDQVKLWVKKTSHEILIDHMSFTLKYQSLKRIKNVKIRENAPNEKKKRKGCQKNINFKVAYFL